MQLRINVIQFWPSIVPMISMIKWQCHTCYCYHYSYYHHFLLSWISWCAVLTNTPGLRDSVVMRVLSDFYWTAATGAGLFTSNSATQQRHAEHCVQAARALCWERVSLTGIPVGNQSDHGNIPDAVTWACVVKRFFFFFYQCIYILFNYHFALIFLYCVPDCFPVFFGLGTVGLGQVMSLAADTQNFLMLSNRYHCLSAVRPLGGMATGIPSGRMSCSRRRLTWGNVQHMSVFALT